MLKGFNLFIKVAVLVTMSPFDHAMSAESVELSLPPASLANWYKPANKRQVWLHTMFRLRRSAQAVESYAAEGNNKLMQKWATEFAKDYRKLPEMVPEWRDEVQTIWADRLMEGAAKKNLVQVNHAMRKLKASCKFCHNEYRAIVAATYRSPDYKKIMVTDSQKTKQITFNHAMDDLSYSVNQIMIALKDDQPDNARKHSLGLSRQLQDLGASCKSCHKDPISENRILGETARDEIKLLQIKLKSADSKASQRQLGHLSVNICARCHGIHRTISGLRNMVLPD